MKRHVVILGAGFGGLELATCLSETASDVVNVTLIDRNDSFYFGFSKLEVMVGRESAEAVRLPYREISKAGVDFRQERVVAVDPAARRVATDAGTHDADFLVVAMGADYDMGATPGFPVWEQLTVCPGARGWHHATVRLRTMLGVRGDRDHDLPGVFEQRLGYLDAGRVDGVVTNSRLRPRIRRRWPAQSQIDCRES